MQTLSRYFVAFLLVIVSHFLDDVDAEKETQQASLEKIEINLEQPGPRAIGKHYSYPCS